MRAEFQTVRVTSVRLVPIEDVPGAATEMVATDRARSFIRGAGGRIIGNLLDAINATMREALASRDMSRRRIPFPAGAYVDIAGRRAPFAAVEICLEQLTMPSNTVVDLAGRFPDALKDAVSGRQWLIEDRERLPRFARSDRDLSLVFTTADDPTYVEIDAVPIPDADPNTGSTVETAIASLQLSLALALAGAGDGDQAPPALAQCLDAAAASFVEGDHAGAEAQYLASLEHGTALAALCNLAYIADMRGEHQRAIDYSLEACRLFPLQAHGFTNACAAFLAAGKIEDARNILDAGRPLHCARPLFRRQEADLMVREGRWQDAARLYYGLVLDDPADARARGALAQCEARMGDLAAAAWDARCALQNAPNDARIVELAMRYAASSGDSPGVLEIAAHAVNVGLASASIYRRAVDAAVAAGDHGQVPFFV